MLGHLLPGGRLRLRPLAQRGRGPRTSGSGARGPAGAARARRDRRLGRADLGAVRARRARDTLRTGSTLVIQPLWFVGVYVGVTALTPYCVRAAREDGRLGRGSAARCRRRRRLPALRTVRRRHAVLAVARQHPAGLAVRLSTRRLLGREEDRRGAVGGSCSRAGSLLFAALLVVFHYPASMVGVPGEARTNSHPPSLLVLALAAAQSRRRDPAAGPDRQLLSEAALLGAGRGRQPVRDDHPVLAPDGDARGGRPASFLGAVPGLTTAPDTLAWIVDGSPGCRCSRCCSWSIARYARGFEAPWRRRRRPAGQRRGCSRRASRCSPWGWREPPRSRAYCSRAAEVDDMSG